MINSEYSPHKIVHHIERLESIKKNGFCVPVTIHLAPTTCCNCQCYYCYVRDYNRNKCDLDRNCLFSFLESVAQLGAKAIEFTGGGEPTVYPYFDEAVAKCHELNLDVGLVTNGFHLNPQVLKNAKWIRVSIDTFDADQYFEIRYSKLPDLSCVKKLSLKYGVVMGASCVITAHNYKNLYSFVITARELGFNNVWLKGVEDSDELVPFIDEIRVAVKELLLLSTNDFRVFVGDLFRNSQDTSKSFRRCMFQHVAMMVYADGSVYPCCSLQGRSEFAYANIYNDSIEEILSKKTELGVEECPLNCFWTNKNKFMEYIMLDNPRHVNFM